MAQTEDTREDPDHRDIIPPPSSTEFDQNRLSKLMNTGLNLSDIKTITFNMAVIDFENIEGNTRVEKIISLIQFCQRQNKILPLLDALAEVNDGINWHKQMGYKAPVDTTSVSAEAISNERDNDEPIHHIEKWIKEKKGTILTLKGPRQSGKSTLLADAISAAKESGHTICLYNFLGSDYAQWLTLEDCLKNLLFSMGLSIGVDPHILASSWIDMMGPKSNMSNIVESQILTRTSDKFLLILDDSDILLEKDFYSDFFSLIRAWNEMKNSKLVWDKFRIILSISRDPVSLVKHNFQSPFNVGEKISLIGFSMNRVISLNQKFKGPVKQNELQDFYNYLAGHPMLTFQALEIMSSKKQSWPDFKQNAMRVTSPFFKHLLEMELVVKGDEALKDSIQHMLSTHQINSNEDAFRLWRAGIITETDFGFDFRCKLYEEYFSAIFKTNL